MIPLRDTVRSRSYPFVTHLLIGINVAVYLLQPAHDPAATQFILTYGLIPARFTDPALSRYFGMESNLFSLLSFMFLHGGFWHLLGNMWFLHIFGDNVEDRLGPLRFLGFYLLCGLISGLAHMMLSPHSQVPTVGASGAIAGVMGAYFILYPASKILTLIPIFIFPWLVEIPAFFFLGFWFLLQFLGAAGSSNQAGGIAWWAHLGGFVAGILLLKVLDRLPPTGLRRLVQSASPKRHSPRLQMIHAQPMPQGLHLGGVLSVTPFEAQRGTSKIVALAGGLRQRTLRVTVPAGIQAGTMLRLQGMGRTTPDGRKGDLYLRIEFVEK
jgi:membrane associated rhomboid family serine protease